MTKETNGSQKLNELSTSIKIPEYNVLLFGETGVGKSTTINAWANYMRYKTFDEAKYGKLELMIPVKFRLPDPVTKEPIDIECRLNDDDDNAKNEAFNGEGYSVTQLPSAYTFKFKDKVLRIIDTPGIGDWRGGTEDREKMYNIFEYLNNYKELHAIVILFKANQTRSTSSFRYCITELLYNLHKDAIKNLIFCFTCSQNTQFRAGEGYHTVKAFLESGLPEVDFVLKSRENCFFIDNESFRFLAALKQDYPFNTIQEQSYRLSWDKSVDQSNKMWDKIIRECKPHNLNDTISMNNVRKFILQIAEPLVRLQCTIEDNIDYIRAQKELLQKNTGDKVDLEQKLNIEVDSLESELLEQPKTICTDAKCIELIDHGKGNVQIDYKTICHLNCSLLVVSTTPGHPYLRNCSAMSSTGQCVVCGCRWDKHQHITLRFKNVKIQAFDKDSKSLVKSAKTTIDGIKTAIHVFDDRIKAYKAEYEVIQEICSKFAFVLMNNLAIKLFYRFCEPYLDLMIDEENAKIQAYPNYSKSRLKSLKNMKKIHQEKVEIINMAIIKGELEAIKLEDIYEYKKILLKLKLTGNQLKQMLETVSLSREKHKKGIPEKILDLTSICFSTVFSSSNSGDGTNNNPKIPEETNYVEKLITNQVNILSIIEQLKVEFKEISIDEKSQTSSPITNMIYHLENARNVILNSNSQATFGDVTMTEKAIQDNSTDDVKSLMATINAMKDFCSKFSSTLDIVKIQETVVSLESVVASSTIYDTQNQTNFLSTAEFSQSKISIEVASQNLINLETVVEEPNSAKPVPEVKIYTNNVSEEKIGIETEGEELIVTETVPEDPIESKTVSEKIENTETVYEEPIDTETAPEEPIVTETFPEESIQSEIVPEKIENTETVSEEPIDTKLVHEESIDLLLLVGVLIGIAFAVGFNIFRNK